MTDKTTQPWRDDEYLHLNGLPVTYTARSANPASWEVMMPGGRVVPLTTLKAQGYRIGYPARPRVPRDPSRDDERAVKGRIKGVRL